MWLINVHTIQLEYVVDERIRQYAILSHTWGEEEVTFQDLKNEPRKAKRMRGYHKIQFTCQQAIRDQLEYAWIDTCCIDKSSSAELSEAINSMFRWYAAADRCYAYLEDTNANGHKLRLCRWFTRGWTLQELLAPKEVLFFAPSLNASHDGKKSVTNSDLCYIGNRRDLVNQLGDITSIPRQALLHEKRLESYSVASKMSWAANRETTRVEDRAYCMLGLFDVNLPMLYGEGMKAFQRLQEEIIRTSTDQSIFLWTCSREAQRYQLLADSVEDFQNCGYIVKWCDPGADYAYRLNNQGLDITILMWYNYALLQCLRADNWLGNVLLPLRRIRLAQDSPYRRANNEVFCVDRSGLQLTASKECLLESNIKTITILRDQPPSNMITMRPHLSSRLDWISLYLDMTFGTVIETFPKESWAKNKIFTDSTRQIPIAYALIRANSAQLVLAFRLDPTVMENYGYNGIHMVFGSTTQIFPEYEFRFERSSTAIRAKRLSILDTMLKATSPSLRASASDPNEPDGRWTYTISVECTERLEKGVYIATFDSETYQTESERMATALTLDRERRPW